MNAIGSITNRFERFRFFLYISLVSHYSYLCVRSEYYEQLVDASQYFQLVIFNVVFAFRCSIPMILGCTKNHHFARNYKAIFAESSFETIQPAFLWIDRCMMSTHPILRNITSLWMKLAQTLTLYTFDEAASLSCMCTCACMQTTTTTTHPGQRRSPIGEIHWKYSRQFWDSGIQCTIFLLESETQVSVGVFSPAQHFRVMKRRIANLPTPVFVINRFAFERNCKTMLEMVRGKGLLLRPHVKTHRTAEGARIQANAERETNVLVTGFVASTLPEVKMLVESKYDLPRDILYGVPISQAKLEPLDAMRQEFSSNEGQIHVMIDHPTQVTFVEDYVKGQEKSPFSAFIKLDTGYHRAGITCDERGVDLALKIIRSPFLSLQGVYSHWLVLWFEEYHALFIIFPS